MKTVPWWQYELRGHGNWRPGPSLKGRRCGTALVVAFQLTCPLQWLGEVVVGWFVQMGTEAGSRLWVEQSLVAQAPVLGDCGTYGREEGAFEH